MPTQRQVKVNNASIEQVGHSRDFNANIAEFIWNGFDAKATEVEILYKSDELGGIRTLSIKDNGEGIIYENLDNTFGLVLDSSKSSVAGTSSYIHGKKGIGRFSFHTFCNEAEWTTVYEKNHKKYQFILRISSDNMENYTIFEDVKEVPITTPTGSTVKFIILEDSQVKDLGSKSFAEYLRKEFGWYLHLNKRRSYKLLINNKTLDYEGMIVDSDNKKITVSHGRESYSFDLNYIEWRNNTGDNYYYNYFLDENFVEKAKKTTTFNKNGINFHHSVYVVSNYFAHYAPSTERTANQGSLFGDDEIMKELNKELHTFLVKKQKQFIERNAETLIKELEAEKVFPKFEDNDLGEARKNEFVTITKSLYRLEPKLFIKANSLQKKSLLAFLQLSVDSDERENIIKIIESIVEMSPEDRAEFAKVLTVTSLSKIVHVMKDITDRIKNIEILKTLVNEQEKYTTERDHIQKIMEKCFWLFGEQYTIVTADLTFTLSLQKYYLQVLNKELSEESSFTLDPKDSKRRMDLFLVRQYPLAESGSRLGEDNLIIELKRPSVDIGIEQMRQIEDYMNIIISSSDYTGSTRNWKFYVVGKNLKKEVQDRVIQNSHEEQFLYYKLNNYRIYALNWDDLFQSFKLKANFILSKLDLKKDVLIEELKTAGINPEEIPDYLTSIATGKSKEHIISPPAV